MKNSIAGNADDRYALVAYGTNAMADLRDIRHSWLHEYQEGTAAHELDAPLEILLAGLLALNDGDHLTASNELRETIDRLRVLGRKELADVLADLQNVYQHITATRH
jgi:hypothetical protein